jgi:aspartate carbamoyltransferase regulatory subunit
VEDLLKLIDTHLQEDARRRLVAVAPPLVEHLTENCKVIEKFTVANLRRKSLLM